jgi:uncharacterized protein (TIGR04222 family)
MQLFSSWTGGEFLLFYIMLLGLSGVASWWIPAQLRSSGLPRRETDPDAIALLAGGRERLLDSVIADLYARGGLGEDGKRKLKVMSPSLPASPAGRTLLAARQSFDRTQAGNLLAVHCGRIAARLRREGLMLGRDEHARLRWLSIAPFAVLFMIGLYRQRAGSALSEPTGFLVGLLVLTVVLAVIRFAKSDPRTKAGIAAVRQLRDSASRLRRAPQPVEAAMAVALFGTGVLVGTPWEPVHAMRQQGGDGGGGGGDSSSSDGGSGDGGGGCGGCGG